MEGSHGRYSDAAAATQCFSSNGGDTDRDKRFGLSMPTYYASDKKAIAPRRSVALFALLAITMVVVSYIVIILLAIACVYLPYLVFTSAEHPPAQLGLLVLGGIVVGAT